MPSHIDAPVCVYGSSRRQHDGGLKWNVAVVRDQITRCFTTLRDKRYAPETSPDGRVQIGRNVSIGARENVPVRKWEPSK